LKILFFLTFFIFLKKYIYIYLKNRIFLRNEKNNKKVFEKNQMLEKKKIVKMIFSFF